jgi:ribosomal protein S18 acetylase RimI-like enzyme
MALVLDGDEALLRPLRREDEPILWEMLYHAIHVPEGAAPPPREIVREPGLRHYVQGWGRVGDLGVLAEVGGMPVGAAWARLLTGDDRGYGYVDDATAELSIAVLPAYRGRGIGTRLLERLLDAARERGHDLCLSVQADNAARRLYERMGFVTLAEEGGALTMVRRWGC